MSTDAPAADAPVAETAPELVPDAPVAETPPAEQPAAEGNGKPAGWVDPQLAIKLVDHLTLDPVAENDRLRRRLHDVNMRDRELRELEDEIQKMDNRIAGLKESMSEAKKERDTRVGALRLAIRRRGRESRLPFPDEDDQDEDDDLPEIEGSTAEAAKPAASLEPSPASPIRNEAAVEGDNAAAAPLNVLGLTDSLIEKLAEADINNVGQLEWAIRNGKFTPGSIKGIGQLKVDEITDKLVAWRLENPTKDPGEKTEAAPPAAETPAAAEQTAPSTIESFAKEWEVYKAKVESLVPKALILAGNAIHGAKAGEWHEYLNNVLGWMNREQDATGKQKAQIESIENAINTINDAK